jgi:hypothetical protein
MLESMKKDINQTAFSILQQATGEVDPALNHDNTAVKGAAGGKARAKKQSASQRIDLARLAATARWKKTN